VGLPEEDFVGKQDGARCDLDVVVPGEEMVGKQDGAKCNRAYGATVEDVVGNQDVASRVYCSDRCNLLPWECLKMT